MIESHSDAEIIQRHFNEVSTLLVNIVDHLSYSDDPVVSTAATDIMRASRSLSMLEQALPGN
jgi:hypothetical protein